MALFEGEKKLIWLINGLETPLSEDEESESEDG